MTAEILFVVLFTIATAAAIGFCVVRALQSIGEALWWAAVNEHEANRKWEQERLAEAVSDNDGEEWKG